MIPAPDPWTFHGCLIYVFLIPVLFLVGLLYLIEWVQCGWGCWG